MESICMASITLNGFMLVMARLSYFRGEEALMEQLWLNSTAAGNPSDKPFPGTSEVCSELQAVILEALCFFYDLGFRRKSPCMLKILKTNDKNVFRFFFKCFDPAFLFAACPPSL